MSLRIVPVSFRDACGYVEMWHRHHGPPRGMKFALGVADQDDVLRGVAIIGRPVARAYQDGLTLEVNRTATDGTRNANSMQPGWNRPSRPRQITGTEGIARTLWEAM